MLSFLDSIWCHWQKSVQPFQHPTMHTYHCSGYWTFLICFAEEKSERSFHNLYGRLWKYFSFFLYHLSLNLGELLQIQSGVRDFCQHLHCTLQPLKSFPLSHSFSAWVRIIFMRRVLIRSTVAFPSCIFLVVPIKSSLDFRVRLSK